MSVKSSALICWSQQGGESRSFVSRVKAKGGGSPCLIACRGRLRVSCASLLQLILTTESSSLGRDSGFKWGERGTSGLMAVV